MIGIIVIGLALIWLSVAVKISRKIPIYLKIQKLPQWVGYIIFIVVFSFPFLDEIVGRIQYQNLCSSEENLWVHPDAEKVLAARSFHYDIVDVDGFAIPVQKQVVDYVDVTNGKPFFRIIGYHTPGGIIMRSGLNLGHSTSCWSEKRGEAKIYLKIDELLKRGENLN